MFTADSLIALATLASLEVVLGIDNIIFLAIVAGRLPEDLREKARIVGLSVAVVSRFLLLLTLSWFMGLTAPLISFGGAELSGRDVILILGGLFLIAKATLEIHKKVEHSDESPEMKESNSQPSFWGVITQILIIDMVFSLDSVITAVGMVSDVRIMIGAIIISLGVMLLFSKKVVNFIDHHPTIKVLALSFLVLIGFVLVLDGFGKHIDKAYIYSAMGFSLAVETINLKIRSKKED
jgi:predicted tellurium resistance membrane protein TerC